MTDVTAELVKMLRSKTGAGLMDCRNALIATGGDVEAAEDLLRANAPGEGDWVDAAATPAPAYGSSNAWANEAPAELYDVNGVRVFECAAQGASLLTERDAADLVNAAWNSKATMMAIPVARLGDGFLRLKTRIAGPIFQKFATYGIRLAILGDVSAQIAASTALGDFIRETNSGDSLWFVRDRDELARKLEAAP